MRSLKIDFSGDNPTLSLETIVDGVENEGQMCLVNIATPFGSDPISTDRGTNLFPHIMRGASLFRSNLRHLAGQARLRTLYYVNLLENDVSEALGDGDRPDALSGMTLELENVINLHAYFTVAFTANNGDTWGLNAPI